MKERAAEGRAQGKKGAKKATGLDAVLEAIAKMAPEDGALAEQVHQAITANAPELSPKTWYGMPAYANKDGKVVVFFQDAGKVQVPLLDPGFPGHREHGRRRHLADDVRTEQVDSGG